MQKTTLAMESALPIAALLALFYFMHDPAPLDKVFAFVMERPFLQEALFVTSLAFAAHASLASARGASTPPNTVGRRIVWRTFLALTIFFPVASFRVASLASVSEDSPRWYSHFEAVFYSVAQAATGKTLLADLPAQYGLYGEFLAPWFHLIGLSVFTFTSTMTAIALIGTLSLYGVMQRLVRTRRILGLWLFAIAQMAVWGLQAIDVAEWNLADPYYQYIPIRFLFPAAGGWLFLWFTRRPTAKRAAAMGLLCGLALAWNMDSGIAVTGAFFVTLAAVAVLCRRGKSLREAARWAAIAATATVLTLGMFAGYLAFESGGRFRLEWLTQSQRVFYMAGVTMTPMPALPSAWGAVVCVYLLSAAVGAEAVRRGGRSPVWRLLIFLSVLGMGLFTYYQGRSESENLAAVSWPAIMALFLLTDLVWRGVRLRQINAAWAVSAAPGLMLGMTAAACYLGDLPHTARIGAQHWRHAFAHAQGPIVDNIAFIKAEARPGESSAILAPHQAVYIAESGVACDLAGPGFTELQLRADADVVTRRLLEQPVRHFFLGTSANWPTVFGPDFQLWIRLLGPEFKQVFTRYTLESISPSGTLMHWVPIEFAPEPSMPGTHDRTASLFADTSDTQAHYRYDTRNKCFRDATGREFPFFLGNPVDVRAAFSVEVVLKPEERQVPFAYIVGNRIDAEGFAMLHAERDRNTYTMGPAPFTLAPGEWSYVCGSVSGRDVCVFVNGALAAQGALDAPAPPSDLPVAIGNGHFGDRPFHGTIQEVRIRSCVITAEESQQTYQTMRRALPRLP